MIFSSHVVRKIKRKSRYIFVFIPRTQCSASLLHSKTFHRFSTFRKYLEILFCFENRSDPLWEKIVLLWKKLFQDSRLNFDVSRKIYTNTLSNSLTRFFPATKMRVSQGIGEQSSNAGFWQKKGFNLDIVAAEIYFSK